MSKRKAYAVQEKLYFVQRVRDGESQASLSREIGVPKSTICGWIKDEDKLKQFATETRDKDGLWRKRTKTAKDTLLDTLLFEWFVQERQNGSILNGKVIKLQAIKLSRGINGSDDKFLASEGWLWRFQKRHGIKLFNLTDECQSDDDGTTNHNAADAFPKKLRALLESEDLVEEQVYNARETGLNYKMLPTKSADDSIPFCEYKSNKKNKERVTVLLTCNKTGSHKLKPFILGKTKNPRSLYHTNRETLPVLYQYSKKAWMTTYIFQEWFFEHFVPEVTNFLQSRHLEERAILLLDNCPAHYPVGALQTLGGKIKAYLLPEITTPLIQPLDQGIIQAAKAHYRRTLVNSLVESEMQPIAFLETVSIKDVMFWVARAWKNVTNATIEGSWIKGVGRAFGNVPFEDIELQDITDAVEKFQKYAGEHSIDTDHVSVLKWSTCDDHLPITKHRKKQEFADSFVPSSSDEDDEDHIQHVQHVQHVQIPPTDEDRQPMTGNDDYMAASPTDVDRKPSLAMLTCNEETAPPPTDGQTDVAEAIRCLNYTIRHMETSPGNFFEPMSLVLIKMVLDNLKTQQSQMEQ